MKNYMSIPEFYQRFPTEESCKDFITQERWPDGVICQHCGHDKVYEIKGGMGYKCAECKERFSVRTGMIMEHSRLPLQKWLLAINLMTTARKGISSVQFAKNLGVTQKTAWYLEGRIREACKEGICPLTGEVEMDATYIGGKEGNKHASKRMQAGRGTVGKTPVMGMKERGGRVKAGVVGGEDSRSIVGFAAMNVNLGSTLYTDESRGYTVLGNVLSGHETVRHSAGEYVNGKAHTNGIESFWALLKRGYVGTHHWWSIKHLHRYVAEYVYRHNTIGLSGEKAIGRLIRNSEGKKLSYKQLIGEVA